MVLTATEAGIDDTVTLEGASLMNSTLSSQDSILPAQIPISVKREVSHTTIKVFTRVANFSHRLFLVYKNLMWKCQACI